jgi:hypothetical protein
MVHLTRGYPGEPTHNGFVLGLGRDLVLLHQFHDFYPEGYAVLRVDDIKQVRSGKHERFWETMLRGEGLMRQVGITDEVPLDDFRSLLADFQIHGRYIIIECESKEAADDDYLIGRILILGDKTVSIMHFDSLGNWYDEPAVVAYDDITKVQFECPYMRITKYLGKPPDCF